MTDATAMDALIEAVEAGTATDDHFTGVWDWLADDSVLVSYSDAWDAYRGVLNAAVQIVETLLPGWSWGLHKPNTGVFRAYVVKRSPLRPMPVNAESANPACALLLAALRAKRGEG